MQEQRVRLELDETVMARLLNSGKIRVEEFRCLDKGSKEKVWRICLGNCK